MGGDAITTSNGSTVEGPVVEGTFVDPAGSGSRKAKRTGEVSASKYVRVGDQYLMVNPSPGPSGSVMSPITVSSASTTPFSTPGWDGQPGSSHVLRDTIFGLSVEKSSATPVATTPNGDPSPLGSGSTTYSEAYRKTMYAGTTPADDGLLRGYIQQDLDRQRKFRVQDAEYLSRLEQHETNRQRDLQARDAEYQLRQDRRDEAQRMLFEQQAETNRQFQQMVMATSLQMANSVAQNAEVLRSFKRQSDEDTASDRDSVASPTVCRRVEYKWVVGGFFHPTDGEPVNRSKTSDCHGAIDG